MMKASPVILLVGKACYEAFLTKLQNDPTLKLKMISLKFTFTIFRKRTSFYAAYNSATGRLQHLIFYTPHASRFLQGGTIQEGIYTDLVWNTAAQIASIPILSAATFSILNVAVNVQYAEKRLAILEKARLVEAERGHPSLEKARQAHADKEYPGLRKGWETNKRNGYIQQKLASTAAVTKRLSRTRNRLTTMLNSKEVCLLLSYQETELTPQECQKLCDRFADMFNTPTWDTYTGIQKSMFNKRLIRAHQSFTKYKQSPELFLEIEVDVRARFVKQFAVWYNKETPFGLPDDGISQFTVHGFHYAIALFYRHDIYLPTTRLSFINYLTTASKLTLLYFYITLIVYRNTRRFLMVLLKNLQQWKSSP
jgi:hypothetical protein